MKCLNYFNCLFHNKQVFRLFLKTSVEKNAKELNPFLAGFAFWQSLVFFYLLGDGGSAG